MSRSRPRTAPRPRALLACPIAPARAGNGLAMRAGLFLEGLARDHDVDVVVLSPFAPASGPAHADDLLEETAASRQVLARSGDAWPTRLLGTADGRRRAAELYPLPTICPLPDAAGRAEIARLVAGAELVQILRAYLAPSFDVAFDSPRRPAIALDVDELDSHVIPDAVESARAARIERHYVPLCDQASAASGAEAARIGAWLGRTVETVPNAVRPPPAPIGQHRPRSDLLFVGNLSYAPNVDAVRWLCDCVLPLLAGVRVVLAGSGPGPEVLALAQRPGVTVAADVPDVTPWYRDARVAVVPIRSGGGTRTKIAEAQVHGIPIVSTSIGAAGLEAGCGAGILLADDAAGFAACCRELLDDPVRAAAIGAAGRRSATDADDVVALIAELSRRARTSR